MIDDFALLGVEPGASVAQIKRARDFLIRALHPDRFVGQPKMQAEAAERMKRVNAAYDRLTSGRSSSRQQQPDSSAYRTSWEEAQRREQEERREQARQEQQERADAERQQQQPSGPERHWNLWGPRTAAIVICCVTALLIWGTIANRPSGPSVPSWRFDDKTA